MPDTDLGNTFWLGIRDTAVKDGPSHLFHLHGDKGR